MNQVRLASCVRRPGDWTDARRHDTPIQEYAQHTPGKVSTLRVKTPAEQASLTLS